MALKAGIVGLPNVGKSTLFNAITNSQVEAANYPFATIEPNVGVVEIMDPRLERLAEIVNPKRILRATFEFIDIAGLVEGASKGEGLGNKFLSNIREVNAIVQVVRCFDDPDITHVLESVNPVRDMDIINMELMLADMESIENILRRIGKKIQNTSDKDMIAEHSAATKFKEAFEKEIPARNVTLTKDEAFVSKSWNLLTSKPLIYVGNVEEKFVSNPEEAPLFKIMKAEAEKQGCQAIGISAKIEGELSMLEGEDKQMFLDDLGIQETGLAVITRNTFKLLKLATYFTAGVQEVRAWTFNVGMSAPECAGIIHTDFQRGFIKAEIMSYEDYDKLNGEQGVKDAGKMRLEGKDYIMKDGDIVHFKFNV